VVDAPYGLICAVLKHWPSVVTETVVQLFGNAATTRFPRFLIGLCGVISLSQELEINLRLRGVPSA